MKKLIQGFTMIELLVVIAIIGILAAAVLASINPIEQINKGRDTRTQAQLKEILQGAERYWTVNELYPWNVDQGTMPGNDGWDAAACAAVTACTTFLGVNPQAVSDSEFDSDGAFEWAWLLQDTSEFKAGFYGRFVEPNMADYYAYKGADEDTTFMCFLPASDQFSEQAITRCNTTTNGLPTTSAIDPCDVDGAGALGTERDNVFVCIP